MLALLQPIKAGIYPALPFPEQDTVTLELENAPGTNTGPWDVKSLNAELAITVRVQVLLNVNLSVTSLHNAITFLEKQKTIAEAAITVAKASEKAAEEHVTAVAGEPSPQKTLAAKELQDAKLAVKVAESELEAVRMQLENTLKEENEIGAREAREVFNTIQPIVIGAVLRRQRDGEIIWSGSLPLIRAATGAKTESKLLTVTMSKTKAKQKYRLFEGEITFLHESHTELPGFSIEENEQLQLEIAFNGPAAWQMGENAFTLINEKGEKETRAEEQSGVKLLEETESHIKEGGTEAHPYIWGGGGGSEPANALKVISSAFSINYER